MSEGAKVLWVVIAVMALIFALIALGALLFQITWNHGITALVSDAGGHVGQIGFWTAFFSAWFVQVVGALFTKTGSVNLNKEN